MKRYLYTFNNFAGKNTSIEVDYNPSNNSIIQDGDWYPLEDYGNYLLSAEKMNYDEAFNLYRSKL